MLSMDTTPEYTLSFADCVKHPPSTNLAYDIPHVYCQYEMTLHFSVVTGHLFDWEFILKVL